MRQTSIGYSIDRAVELLKADELVAIPTETVYGLAGNGLSTTAVAKIFEAKNRPHFDPLILHTDDMDKINAFAVPLTGKLAVLSECFMPGPLTMLLERKSIVPDLTTSGLPKVAVRIPSHPTAQRLLSKLDFPLAAPSANPFGYISPTTPQHVLDNLDGKLSYILDGGRCDYGIESTIVEQKDDTIVVLRKGSIPVESIEKVVGKVTVNAVSTSKPSAPGMLHQHYAPRTPMRRMSIEEALQMYAPEQIGVLAWNTCNECIPTHNQRVLSPTSDLREAAQNLFRYMRELDQIDLMVITVDYLPEKNLGVAINDKIRRATII